MLGTPHTVNRQIFAGVLFLRISRINSIRENKKRDKYKYFLIAKTERNPKSAKIKIVKILFFRNFHESQK